MDNSTEIPVNGVVPVDQMVGGDEEDTRLLRVMASSAENYLRCFPWCEGVRESYFGDGYGGIVAVFLFRILPAREGVPAWLWSFLAFLYCGKDLCDVSQALNFSLFPKCGLFF